MSPRASRDGKEGRRSWRYAKSSSNAAGSRQLLRILLTLLLLVMAGVFFWVVWRTPYQNAHLAIIEVPANRRVSTTPFAHNDVMNLLAVEILHERKIWTDIRDSSDFAERVEPNSRDLLRKPYDNLILYINAPGISDNGTAYLTHSDFLAPDARSDGRHAVSDLLAKVAAAGQGVKLIVLDSTSVDIDPRLGLVVNEFVRLLEADVKNLDKDSNLFVLLPSGPFQVSTTSYGDRQSLFGKFLADGLAGAADREGVGDGNRFVTLHELFEHVRFGCANSIDSKLDVQQTPVLLQAGIGYVGPEIDLNTEQFRLTAITGKERRPAQEPPKATEEKGDTSEEKQSEKAASRLWPVGRAPVLALMQAPAGSKEGPVEADVEPEENPGAAEQPAESDASQPKAPSEKAEAAVNPQPAPAKEAAQVERTPREQLLSRLEKAWRLRDAIQNPHPPNVTPVTFAPHLWRALEAELLFVERQVLADPAFDQRDAAAAEGEAGPVLPSPKNVAAVEDLIITLTSLNAAISTKSPQRSPANDRSLLTRLLKAWDRYAETQLEAEERFTLAEAREVVQFRNHARDFDSLVYSLPYYVRWHARAHQSLPIVSDQHLRLQGYLDATVRLATTLSSLRATRHFRYTDQHRLEQVSKQLAEALSLRSALDDALWTGDGRDSPIIMERLLATPLLDAERRMQLLRALGQVTPGAPSDRGLPDARQVLSGSSSRWQRLHAHCELELRLVELAFGADDDGVKSLAEELAKASTLTNAKGSEAKLWVTYRRVGALFGQCYESLPRFIIDDDAGDYAVHFVDSRDVDDKRNNGLDARDALQLHLEYEPEGWAEIVAEQREFDLKLNETRELVLTIRATREKDASEPLQTQVDSALLDVTSSQPGQVEKKAGWYEKTVVYHVQAKPDIIQLPGRKTANVKLWTEASEQLDRKLTLTFTLPRADQVSLEVLRLSTRSQYVQQEQDGSLTLGVFPANLPKAPVTEFQFRARNESGEPRKIRAELYLIKEGRVTEQQKHGTISQDRRKELFREQANSLDMNQLELVAEVDGVEVGVDEFKQLAFKAPAAAAPAVAPAASTPEKPVSPPSLKDAGYGMLCRLKDEKTGVEWVKWIQIEPTPLQQYVDAISWYESGRVVVELTGTPDRDDHFPTDGLTLTWDAKPDFPAISQRRIEATILKPGDKQSLFIDVEPDDITREVYIGVNGCPRVLSFRVPCRQRAERVVGAETRKARRSIAITKLSIPANPQVLLDLKPPVTIAMPVDALPVDALRVHFQLDAPVEGLRLGRGDAVEVLVGNERLGIAYGDRHLSTHLSGVGDNGVVELGMQVEEQFIDITPRVRNAKLDLIAKLTVDNREPLWSQAIPVIFDGAPPIIQEPIVVPRQLDLESKQVVEVEVEELSGISEVRYWFAVTPRQSVEKPLTAALIGSPVRQDTLLRQRFSVDTSGLDEGDYFLTIQVDDALKRASNVKHTKIQIKKKKEPEPVIATIWGNIQFSSVGDRLFTSVQLLTLAAEEVPGFAAKKVDGGNRYEFTQVPAGEYLVRATLSKGGNIKHVDSLVPVKKPGRLQVNLNLK